MKKIIVSALALLLVLCGLSACGSSGQESESADNTQSTEDTISVVTTIFPVYDWTRNIAGADNQAMEVSMLIDSGVDLHSFQPTAEDIRRIADCDVFIYVGGESDEWVEDALKEAQNTRAVNLMEVLGDRAKEEELVEGMQEDEHEHEHEGEEAEHEDGEHEYEGEEAEHEEAEHEHEEEGPEYDEHIWLSLKNADVLCTAISEALSEVDQANADTYKFNVKAYIAGLDALDAEYTEVTEAAKVRTLLFGDRFPFRYMTDDYGLDYYAAFIGCSAETEASFETIAFLSAKVDELSLKHVMTIEGRDHKIADSIINNTSSKDQDVLTLNSMQSTTAEDVEAGAAYIDIMKANLEVLKTALN